MALPPIHKSPTPKRVAAYLIDTAISHGLHSEIAAMEAAYDVELTDKQKEDVIKQYNQYAQRVRNMLGKAY